MQDAESKSRNALGADVRIEDFDLDAIDFEDPEVIRAALEILPRLDELQKEIRRLIAEADATIAEWEAGDVMEAEVVIDHRGRVVVR